MKNYKLMPLLAMTALLAGCGVNKGAKAPKFAKLGEEISAAELIEVVSSNDFLGAWTNGELETPSAKFVKKTYSQTNEKLYSNKKVISTRSYKDSAENSFELDMTSLRGKYSYVYESEENVKNQVITTKEKEKEVTNTIYQFCNSSHTGEEKEYLIRANLDEKTFHVIADSSTATEEGKLEMFFDQVLSQTDFAFPYGSIYACSDDNIRNAKEVYDNVYMTYNLDYNSEYERVIPRININDSNYRSSIK